MRTAVRVSGHEAAVSNLERPTALTPPSGRPFRFSGVGVDLGTTLHALGTAHLATLASRP